MRRVTLVGSTKCVLFILKCLKQLEIFSLQEYLIKTYLYYELLQVWQIRCHYHKKNLQNNTQICKFYSIDNSLIAQTFLLHYSYLCTVMLKHLWTPDLHTAQKPPQLFSKIYTKYIYIQIIVLVVQLVQLVHLSNHKWRLL